jgi:hypothetical protein
MFPLSSSAAALLSALVALASFDATLASASHHTTNDQDRTTLRTAHETRRLMNNDGGAARHGRLGESRRLQEPIRVEVNFVNVKNTAGLGATEAQVRAQMDTLNAAFRPDFVFNLNATQDVTSDLFFGGINSTDGTRAVERQMKEAHRRGGRETLNVYAVDTLTTTGSNGWAWYAMVDVGVLDGVVYDHSRVLAGGTVSFEDSS